VVEAALSDIWHKFAETCLRRSALLLLKTLQQQVLNLSFLALLVQKFTY
jgi:hypothetical protein